jgi:hypothetical protein
MAAINTGGGVYGGGRRRRQHQGEGASPRAGTGGSAPSTACRGSPRRSPCRARCPSVRPADPPPRGEGAGHCLAYRYPPHQRERARRDGRAAPPAPCACRCTSAPARRRRRPPPRWRPPNRQGLTPTPEDAWLRRRRRGGVCRGAPTPSPPVVYDAPHRVGRILNSGRGAQLEASGKPCGLAGGFGPRHRPDRGRGAGGGGGLGGIVASDTRGHRTSALIWR